MKTVYNGAIVRRFMTGEELAEFEKRYEAALKRTAAKELELTSTDLEIVAAYKRGVDMAEIRRMYNVSDTQIIARVAKAVRKGIA